MYRRRCIEDKLEVLLRIKGAVYLKGIKGCGKTTTGRQYANSLINLGDLSLYKKHSYLIDMDAHKFLDEKPPLLLDEWQVFPDLWSVVRRQVDFREGNGQFILTGSSLLSPKAKEKILHSGIGRISHLEMYPMSLYESGDSTGEISLQALFDGTDNFNNATSDLKVSDIAHLICKGGWANAGGVYKPESLRIAQEYYNELITKDISSYDNVNRNSELCANIIKAIARNISSSVSKKTIYEDIMNHYKVSEDTIDSYLKVLYDLFVYMPIESWNYRLRSGNAIRRTPTRYFSDPSIAAASLSITPTKLIEDFNTFELLFKNLCIRDLNVYTSVLEGYLFKYQDNYGLEVDSIIELRDDSWGAFQIRLGQSEFDEAAKNLLKLNSLMFKLTKRPPKFLAILTGIQYFYKRVGGVLVIPIGCLKN